MSTHYIVIPERLQKRLYDDHNWAANVTKVINNVNDIFITTPKFFPEYTNHGATHINHVLEISDKLIPDETLKKITPKTLGIYLISAILHDIGMFVTYDTFKDLINDDGKCTKISPLDNQSMGECWENYLSELKHYSGKTLIRKFGTTEINFTKLPDAGKVNDQDILVIGEFLRQHHHKISQYIILHGLIDNDLLENAGINEHIRILIGITARSHGMNIRDTESYLETIFGRTNRPIGTEIFYLMSVLRLADYLDAGEERASHIIESMNVKYSEISKKEFEWNQSIRYEDFNWKGQESVSIDVFPENPEQFINVTKWLNSVQHEVDLCWAIIGEKYGLSECALTIRRVHSNIFDESVIKRYEEKFYTKEVSLKANADILALLIEPLYGNDPSYGVRELLQNATDACKEMKEKLKGKEYKGKVCVSLDTKNKVFTIKDNGIGMNIDTIVNYYLSAGSSYRHSDAWIKDFSDSEGKSKVLRNGRFGVGVLATFLLGNTATVTTRHVDDQRGWKFDIQLNQDNIEIKRTDIDTDIGTTVSINLSDEVIDKLNDSNWGVPDWHGWYFDKFPEVIYLIDEKRIDNAYPDLPWHLLRQKEYKKYSWIYNYIYINQQRGSFNAVCNSIIIPGRLRFTNAVKYRFNISVPILKIEDPEGRLPINLSRSKLLEIPCQEKLFTDCCKYVLAKLLTVDMDRFVETEFLNFNFVADKGYGYKNFILAENGYTLCDVAFMKHSGMQFLNVFYTPGNFSRIIGKINRKVPVAFRNFRVDDAYDKRNIIESLLKGNMLGEGVYCDLNYIHMNSEAHSKMDDGRFSGGNNSLVEAEKLSENHYLLTFEHATRRKEIDSLGLGYSMAIETELRFADLSDDIMLNVLKEYIPPNTFIPYDLEERKAMFPKAFEELKEYMKH